MVNQFTNGRLDADIQMTMNCYVHKREKKIIEANDLISGSFTAL